MRKTVFRVLRYGTTESSEITKAEAKKAVRKLLPGLVWKDVVHQMWRFQYGGLQLGEYLTAGSMKIYAIPPRMKRSTISARLSRILDRAKDSDFTSIQEDVALHAAIECVGKYHRLLRAAKSLLDYDKEHCLGTDDEGYNRIEALRGALDDGN